VPLGSFGRMFGYDLALDPGSESVRALGRSGEVVAVPALLGRVDPGRGSFLRKDLVGESAKTLQLRSMGEGAPAGLPQGSAARILRPISRGAVTDVAAAERLFAHVFREAPGRTWGARPRVVAGVNAGLSTVELGALVEALESAGARAVSLVPGLVACALALQRSRQDEQDAPDGGPAAEGGGEDVHRGDRLGSPFSPQLVIELGAERTGIGIASRAGVLASTHVPLGFRDLDTALAGQLRRRGLPVGAAEAARAREGLGLPAPGGAPTSPGPLSDTEDVLPRDVGAAIAPFILWITDEVRAVLARAPEGVAESLLEYGAVLAGAPAATPGLAEFIAADLELPVCAAHDPAALRVKGLALVAEDNELLAHVAVEA